MNPIRKIKTFLSIGALLLGVGSVMAQDNLNTSETKTFGQTTGRILDTVEEYIAGTNPELSMQDILEETEIEIAKYLLATDEDNNKEITFTFDISSTYQGFTEPGRQSFEATLGLTEYIQPLDENNKVVEAKGELVYQEGTNKFGGNTSETRTLGDTRGDEKDLSTIVPAAYIVSEDEEINYSITRAILENPNIDSIKLTSKETSSRDTLKDCTLIEETKFVNEGNKLVVESVVSQLTMESSGKVTTITEAFLNTGGNIAEKPLKVYLDGVEVEESQAPELLELRNQYANKACGLETGGASEFYSGGEFK